MKDDSSPVAADDPSSHNETVSPVTDANQKQDATKAHAEEGALSLKDATTAKDSDTQGNRPNELSLVITQLQQSQSTEKKGVPTTHDAQDAEQLRSPTEYHSERLSKSLAAAKDLRDEAELKQFKNDAHRPAAIDTSVEEPPSIHDISQPSTPVPTARDIDLPADKNAADYVTPPTPGAAPTSEFADELENGSGDEKSPAEAWTDVNTAESSNANQLVAKQPNDGVIHANNLGPREQERNDEAMREGVYALFNNNFTEAREIFDSKAKADPLYALGLGAMASIEALTTSDPEKVAKTIDMLTETYQFANGQISAAYAYKPLKDKMSDYITNLMGTNTTGLPNKTSAISPEKLKTQPDFIPNGALRAHVIKSECCLLMAMVYLKQETVVGYLKCGLNLRRAYNSYSYVWQEYKKMGQEFNRYMDRDTISAVQFGIGSVHLLLSSLPAKILKVVSAFGWKADKHLGFALLKLCMEGERIRSPLASMMLLTYYVTLMTYCPLILTNDLIQSAIEILLGAQKTFPNSALFLYYAGRISRLSRNTPLSSQSFMYTYEVSRGEWAEGAIGHMASYEMAFNCAIGLDWASAALRMVELQGKYGSPAFNKYFYGACMEMLGNRSEAILSFAQVTKLVAPSKRKPQLDQFLLHRIEFYERSGYQDMDFSLPAYEILYLWNLFANMNSNTLERCLEQIDETLNVIYRREKREYEVRMFQLVPDLPPPDYYDQRATLLLFKSAIYNSLGRSKDAIVHLNWIIDNKNRIPHSKWVVPYAYWESGTVSWFQGDIQRARNLWDVGLSHSGYDFEYRLAIQLNLAIARAAELGAVAPDQKAPKGVSNHGRKRLPLTKTNGVNGVETASATVTTSS